jgi:hypothetical protein
MIQGLDHERRNPSGLRSTVFGFPVKLFFFSPFSVQHSIILLWIACSQSHSLQTIDKKLLLASLLGLIFCEIKKAMACSSFLCSKYSFPSSVCYIYKTQPFLRCFILGAQSGQYHLPFGWLVMPTHSKWNHSILHCKTKQTQKNSPLDNKVSMA